MILAPLLTAQGETLELSISPALFSQNVSATSGTTSSSATLTISGGVGPYTAFWISDNADIGVTSPTSTTSSTFTWANLPSLFDTHFAVVTVGVNDSLGNYAEYLYSVVITRTS